MKLKTLSLPKKLWTEVAKEIAKKGILIFRIPHSVGENSTL